jgi:hypothetical protein
MLCFWVGIRLIYADYSAVSITVRAVKTRSGYEIPYAELHRLLTERGI